MILNKVFIPCAGIGSRLNNLTNSKNKALIAINNKPIISHIIENFSNNVIFVIALGHKGNLLKNYLKSAYKDRNFIFVKIKNYSGPKSSLGYTMNNCSKFLNEPFVFCSCDTLFKKKIKFIKNDWIGYDLLNDRDNLYRKVIIKNKRLLIKEKNFKSKKCYIGLAGIYNHKRFWYAFRNNKEKSLKTGEVEAINCSKLKFITKKFRWWDTGNLNSFNKAKNKFEKNKFNILEKENESIWFVNRKVVKFNNDNNFIEKRFLRSKKLSGYVPKINFCKNNIYAYDFVDGDTFSKIVNLNYFEKLLFFSKEFWKKKYLNNKEKEKFYNNCKEFYKSKTISRVRSFLKKNKLKDKYEIINDTKVKPAFELLKRVNWENISNGIPVRFHGDYHFENIVYDRKKFIFLDWRQDFNGILDYGDIYYDLAKLLHGVIVSHQNVVDNKFSIYKTKTKTFISIKKIKNYKKIFKKYLSWLYENNYDLNKVHLVTALIYLNIAVLHHHPYDKFLFSLGKLYLNNILNGDYNDDRNHKIFFFK